MVSFPTFFCAGLSIGFPGNAISDAKKIFAFFIFFFFFCANVLDLNFFLDLEGCAEGFRLGLDKGCAEGFGLGLDEGCLLGLIEGCVLGLDDGGATTQKRAQAVFQVPNVG